MTHIPGQWSPEWAKAEDRYWRGLAYRCGACPGCGFKLPQHEQGCSNAPYVEPEEEEPEETSDE